MSKEFYSKMISELATIKNIDKATAAKIIIDAVKSFEDNKARVLNAR